MSKPDKGVYSPCGRAAVLAQGESAAARQAIAQLYALLAVPTATQRETLPLLRRHARQYPEIKRFLAVPGVGLIGAERFSAYTKRPIALTLNGDCGVTVGWGLRTAPVTVDGAARSD
jgi:hypothetical protein